MNDKKKYVCRRKSDREKKGTRRTFFSVCYRSAQFDFFHIYIYIAVTERKLKKVERREESCSTTTLLFFFYCVCVCVCVFVFFTLSLFFCMCVRAFGVCKYINASESRQIEKREKKKKKKVGAENEWETHELFYAFSMLIIVKEEERKGNGTKEKEQNRKVGQPTIGKNNPRERKEKQSRLEMCIDVEYVQKKMHTNIYSSYL